MAQNSLTVADHTVNLLAAWGADTVFGVPGDTVLPILEGIRKEGTMRFIATRNETAAGLMASAYAKVSGRLGACLADAGPGAVQLLAGIYDAYMDRIPLVAITGGLPTDKAGTHWPQDADLGSVYGNATVANQSISSARQAPEMMEGALRQAILRTGPVRIGLPLDIQQESLINPPQPRRPEYLNVQPHPNAQGLDAAAFALDEADRPLLFVGLGANNATNAVTSLANAVDAVIVHTLPAVGIIPGDHPRNLGVVGDFGSQAAADALGRADVILVVGSTWWQPEFVPRGVTIIQVDNNAGHLGLVFPADVAILGKAEQVLPEIQKRVRPKKRPDWQAFLAEARRHLDAQTDLTTAPEDEGVHPAEVMRALGERLNRDAIVTVDVGNNTFWFSRHFRSRGQRVLISGHWRAVGFALPAAIAAKLAYPKRQVVAVTGDGGLGSYLGEFTTAVGYGLDPITVVLNDGVYGEEWYLQQKAAVENYGVEFHNPNFAELAQAGGGAGFTVTRPEELEPALDSALRSGRPAIVDVTVPRVAPNRPTPLARQSSWREALSETMREPDGVRGRR